MSKTASANGAPRHPTFWSRRRLALAIGLIFVAGTLAAALNLRFGIGGAVRRVEPNSLLRLNPRTGETERDEPVGYEPGRISLTRGRASVSNAADTRSGGAPCRGALLLAVARSRWYACRDTDTLVRTAQGRTEGVKVAGISAAPEDAAYGARRVWVVLKRQNLLVAINPFTAETLQTIVVGTDPVAVAVGYGSVWVAASGSGSITRLELREGTVESIGLDYQPSRIAAGAGAVWVTSASGEAVIRIDPRTLEVTKTIRLANPPVDVAAGAGHVWVAIGD